MAVGLYFRLPFELQVQYMMPWEKMLESLFNGDGIIIHGEYEFARKDGTSVKGSHFQSMAGMEYDVPDGKHVMVHSAIVDDPFGNPATKYIDTAGNDIVVPLSDFVAKVKPLGQPNKDAIIIPRALNDGMYATRL
jgi:hypothetical protein